MLLVQAAATGALLTPNENGETAEVTTVAEPEPEPMVQEAEEKPEAKEVTWRDNPNNCDTNTQYIRADNLECTDKRVTAPTTSNKAHPVGCEHYRHLLEGKSWNVDTMLYAMQKESGCNPSAVGDNYPIRGVYAPSCGLLQVRTLPGRPSCEALKDPATNVAAAYAIWQGQGYRAWSVLH